MLRILCAASLVLGTGCAFSDGEPWGEAHFELEAVFDPSERDDGAGRIRTAANYAIELDTLTLTFDSAQLAVSVDTVESVAFDPANPPPGYTICHNGHCDAVDGRLVPYEEVAAEIARNAGGAPSQTIVQTFVPSVEPSAAGAAVGNLACTNGCFIDRGHLSAVTLTLHSVAFAGRVFDRQSGAAARLPEEGVVVQGEADVEIALTRPLEGAVGEDEPVPVRLVMRFELPPHLFDGVDFAAVAAFGGDISGAVLNTALVRSINEHAGLNVTLLR